MGGLWGQCVTAAVFLVFCFTFLIFGPFSWFGALLVLFLFSFLFFVVVQFLLV
jgi:hypothetical protein